MATRDVVVRIRAEIGAFKRDMDAAAAKAKETAKKTEEAGKASESGIGRLAQTANAHEKAWNQVSTGMVASGTAVVGALTLSTKAAMDWESAWTGVTKTVDGTPAQMAEMETGLRKLARTLPSTHAEIAGVAEAAGQLGVARDDILGFTKTMVDLGESTNLTAEDAATNIAQISNVMGTMEREGAKGVERFGSALVALGNDGASTEAEILSMTQRISGAAATIGATESDALALSNTLASMGVKAELGGGVTTRVLLKMRSAADEGGESLEAFARIAGMSADEFGAKFKASPIEALDLVSKGIHRVNEAGGNVTATLKDMGIKGTEETQVMLALANSGDLLADSLELGAKAWSENTALVDEATKRYETAESKVKIAWNNIKDAAISAGSVILPVVADIAGVVADLAGAFSDLPGPVQTALVVLGGLAGVGALAAGGFMKIMNWLPGTIAGMQALGVDAPRASRAVGILGKTLGGITAVGAGIVASKIAIEGINKAARNGQPDLEAYFNLLATGGAGSAITELDFSGGGRAVETYRKQHEDLAGLSDEAVRAARAIEQMGKLNSPIGWLEDMNVGHLADATNEAKRLQDAMGATARLFEMGEVGKGQEALQGFTDQLQLTDERVAKMIDGVPTLKSALTSLATESGIKLDPNNELALVDLALGRITGSAPAAGAALSGPAAEGMQKLGDSAGDTSVDIDKLNQKVDDFYDNLVNKGMVVIGENEALRRLQESINSASDTIAENGKVVNKNGDAYDKTSKKYLESASELDSLAASTLSVIDPMRTAGATTEEMAAQISLGREEFIKQAQVMGYSKEAAEAYADKLNLIPGAVYIQFDSNTDDLAGKLTEIHELVQSTPDGKVTIEENSPVVISALEALGYIVTTLPDGRIQVSETGTDATGKKIDETAGKKRTAKINAEAITGAAQSELDALERPRYSTLTVHTRYTESGASAVHRGGAGGLTGGGYTGGLVGQLIDGFAGGGLVPGVAPLNSHGDNILATVNGKPFGLRSGEMVVNEEATKKNLPLLQAINDGAVVSLPGLAGGGLVGKAEKRVKSAQKAYDSIDGKKANKARKQAAKDQLDAAKAELKAAKESKKKSDEAAKEAHERAGRLGEARRDLRVDLRRGDIVDSFTSGSGLSQVDKLLEVSRNKDYSMGKRKTAAREASALEKALGSLTSKSEKLKTALEAATEQAEDLRQVRDAVAGGLRDEFSLSGFLKSDGETFKPLTAKGMISTSKGAANRIAGFGKKLDRLRRKGYSAAVVQEVAELGSAEGGRVADALLGGSKSEVSELNKQYQRLDYWSGQAGESVTKSMYRGGVDAADGLVRGLEGKTKDVEDAFYKLGKSAEKSFKKSLGIKSPSRVMMAAGVNVGEGAELGILSKVRDVSKAAEQLMSPPALTVPPSYEVARHASAQASPAVVIDYDKLAQAMQNVQLQATLKVGNKEIAQANVAGRKELRLPN